MGRALAISLGVLAGCGPSQFACRDAGDCRDGERPGICEATGRCSFADAACPSGRRYGVHAGELAGACVEDVAGSSSGVGVSTTTTSSSSEGRESTSAAQTGSGSDSGPDAGAGSGVPSDSSSGGATPETLVWLGFDDAAQPWRNLGSLGDPSCAGGCPSHTAAEGDGRASFDGVDDCLVIEAPQLSLPALSVTAWIRGGLGDDITTAVGKPLGRSYFNSFAIYWQGAGTERTLRAAINSADTAIALAVPTQPSTDTWFHVALVFDGAMAWLYIDGEVVGGPSPGTMDLDAAPIYIGCDDDHTGALVFQLAAELDELRIYDRALATDELAALASAPPP